MFRLIHVTPQSIGGSHTALSISHHRHPPSTSSNSLSDFGVDVLQSIAMSLHAIDFPHLRVAVNSSTSHSTSTSSSSSSLKQSLLYPTVAQVTPTIHHHNNHFNDSFYQVEEEEEEEEVDDEPNVQQDEPKYSERSNKMSSSSVQIANGSSDNVSASSSSSSSSKKHHPSHSQQAIYVDIETMRMQLSSVFMKFQSRISIDTIRPLHVFLGLNHNAGYCLSPTAFTPPVKLSTNKLVDKSAPEKIKSRVQLNFAYFISNYALLAIMTAVVIALMHPGMVLFVGIVYLLWKGHQFLINHPLIVFGVEVHALLSIKQRFYFLFIMTSVVVVWKCLAPTIFFLSISSFLIITHSLLRDPKDVEASGSSTGLDRYNNKRNDDDDVDIEGGNGDDDHHHDYNNNNNNHSSTTSLIDRAAVKSPGAEKRRNAVHSNGASNSDLLLSKQ